MTTLTSFSPISNREIKLFLDITERTHIPPQPMKALHQLQNDQIIKPADKDGVTVVLNKQDYNDKVLHILSDKIIYRRITHNLTTSILHEVQSLIDHLHIKGIIDDKTHTFLSPKNHTGLLYSTDYQKHTNMTVLYDPLSQPMTPTQRTYHQFIQPYKKALPSFTKLPL